jgi:hypothetical protein
VYKYIFFVDLYEDIKYFIINHLLTLVSGNVILKSNRI